MRKIVGIYLLTVTLFAVTSFYFFSMTHDDAFIVARYAENLVEKSELVFNVGERIPAFTSPLHVFVLAGLYPFTGRDFLLVGHKVVSLVCLLGGVGLLVWPFRKRPLLPPLILLLTIASPFLVHWTVGGLETVILFFLITAVTVLTYRHSLFSSARIALVCFVAGLAFLTRFDAVLYLAPVLLQIFWQKSEKKQWLIGIVAGVSLPLLWLIWASVYFGGPLPTSFYTKTPSLAVVTLRDNAIYMAQFLLFSGAVPVAWLWVNSFSKGAKWPRPFVARHFQALWGIYLGLAFELIYGLTAATTHMMFSYRLLLPYLPAIIIILCDFYVSATAVKPSSPEPMKIRRFLVVTTAVFTLHAFQTFYIYQYSLNGLSLVGEYRNIGLSNFREYGIGKLHEVAYVVDDHWQNVAEPHRSPAIYTAAEGTVAYALPNAYVYGFLTSYRHDCDYKVSLSTDYVFAFNRAGGDPFRQLDATQIEHVEIVWQYVAPDTQDELTVFYNPVPAQNQLPKTLSGACNKE